MIVYLGSAPCEEECVQVRKNIEYMTAMRKQVQIYLEQIQRVYKERIGNLPDGCHLIIQSCEHDFGEYLEVCCSFDESDAESLIAAMWIERNLPEFWDEESVNSNAYSLNYSSKDLN